MKKLMLTVIMVVMLATPCMAEVEPEGIFSIDGTLWQVSSMLFITFPPFVVFGNFTVGFYQGTVYQCNENERYCYKLPYSYINLLMVSIAGGIFLGGREVGIDFFIMQPIGLGVFASLRILPFGSMSYPPGIGFQIGTMFKINDNWTPPSE